MGFGFHFVLAVAAAALVSLPCVFTHFPCTGFPVHPMLSLPRLLTTAIIIIIALRRSPAVAL
jgi:hypothetical protein